MAQTLPVNLATNDVIDETWVDAVRACLAELQPTAWTAVTFQNGWVNMGAPYQDAQYRKVGDVVQLRGMMKSGTITTAAFSLPVGFRPPADLILGTVSNAAVGGITITAAGVVTPSPGSNAWFAVTCQFSVTP